MKYLLFLSLLCNVGASRLRQPRPPPPPPRRPPPPPPSTTSSTIGSTTTSTTTQITTTTTESTTEVSAPSFAIVDTNQQVCFDTQAELTVCPSSTAHTFYGQDAQYASNGPDLVSNGDGTVSDRVTGLMWSQDPGSKVAYSTAVASAGAYNLAGYSDWRLPSIKELYSLIDFSGQDVSSGSDSSSSPFIDDSIFVFSYGDESAGERLIDSQYATSTVYVSTVFQGQECFFGVNFADGRIKCYPTGNKDYFVLYVRGENYGTNNFVTVNGEPDVIFDQSTGLMWSKDDSGVQMDWTEALAYAQTKNAEGYLGYSDWRLPNAKELQSIVDYSRAPDTTSSAAIDPLFATTSIVNEGGQVDWGYYWSSTTHESTRGGQNAAYVAFGRGLGYMNGSYMDVHGAGCQRSDPKVGDSASYPTSFGPQGDIRRVFNFARLVRDT